MTETQRPNIVVLCLDTVRKDVYDRYATRLRERAAVRFEGMRALGGWSVPSHAGMLTGSVPSETGVHAHQRRFDPIDREDTWIAPLERQGYESVCVTSNIYASPVFGFDRFFDRTIPISPSRRLPEGMDVQEHISDRSTDGVEAYADFVREALAHDYPLRSLANGVLLKLDDVSRKLPIEKPTDFGGRAIARTLEREVTESDGPVVAFANLMDAHGPHTAFRGLDDSIHGVSSDFHSSSFRDSDVNVADGLGEYESDVERVRRLYAATVDYLDRVVDDLLSALAAGDDRESILLVTADHGENLGYESEGYLMNHMSSLSEGLLHVPFDVVPTSDRALELAVDDIDAATGADERSATADGATGPVDVTGLSSHADLGDLVRSIASDDPFDPFALERERARAEIVGSGSGIPEGGDESYWDRGQRVVYEGERKYYRDQLGAEAVYDVSGPPSKGVELPDETVPDGLFESAFGDWVADDERDGRGHAEEVDAASRARLEDLGYL
ncbi:sulfatase-like hydrolase/transferase [Haloterrigena alkaliphila]|uniref:Sulfatase-like hydrolase/transferase n=1 Tax=Haloterrigena alkaliphila TaxID=2816475 RepID=A0A8A2VCD7_9EURY|nr:sulfatase-like hydrolase/transferase [Haloterrigena alkaliphila]QSW99703.1 sulfatase-like hydrolase/transferase [Haloterrigena alkaliphila]